MSEPRCENVRELLPDLTAGRLSPPEESLVRAHLHECGDCRDEAELIALLHAGRPSAPADLAARIQGSARAARRGTYHPWWGVMAASVAALALGIGFVSRDVPAPSDEAEVPGIVAGVGEAPVWVADDGLVAGAPALDALSDEALLALLDEMSTQTPGGAA